MLTQEDIQKLKNVLSTKEDVQELKQEVNAKFDRAFEVFATREDVRELKEDIDGLREMVQVLVTSVDKLVKAVSDLSIEYAAISHQLSRHEKWIEQIAEKVGMKLTY